MSSVNDLNNYTNDSNIPYVSVISNEVKFWIYLILLIPSLASSLFSLYYLLWYRALRHALHNHAIIIFLFICLIDQITIYPWMLHFYNEDGIWKRAPFFCTLWLFIDTGLYFTQAILLAWASIERHILVFHEKWVSTKRKRVLMHYVPFIALSIYCFIYYFVIMFYPPCENIYDERSVICVQLCLAQFSTQSVLDSIVNQISPSIIIVLCDIALLIRIFRQKHRMGHSLEWRKYWKMTFQLLLLSIIYLGFELPIALVYFLNVLGVPRQQTNELWEYALFLDYTANLICPIAIVILLPQLKNERNSFIQRIKPPRVIVPIG